MKPAKQYRTTGTTIANAVRIAVYAVGAAAFAYLILLAVVGCSKTQVASQEVAQEFAFSEAWASEQARLNERKLTRSK